MSFIDQYKTRSNSKFGDLNLIGDKAIYKSWIAQIYFLVEHSVPMLKLAFPICSNKIIQSAYKAHVSEEDGHDNLAKMDLLKLDGTDVSKVLRMQETEWLYKIGYDSINSDPSSFVGYIMALEFTAAWEYPQLLGGLESKYGKNSIRFIVEHAEADQDHIETMLYLCENMNEVELINTEEVCRRSFQAVWNLVDAVIEKSHSQGAA